MFGLHLRSKPKPILPGGISMADFADAQVAAMITCKVCGANMASMTQEQRVSHLMIHQSTMNLKGQKGLRRLGL
jgi:hypothetical protein